MLAKYFTLVFVAFVSLTFSAVYAQDKGLKLYIKNTKNGKIELLNPNQMISVSTKSATYNGVFEVLDTNTVKVDSTSISLLDIIEIKAVKVSRRKAGYVVGGVGATFFVLGGLYAIIDGGSTYGTAVGLGAMLGIGTPLLATGAALAYLKKKYKVKNEKWELRIL